MQLNFRSGSAFASKKARAYLQKVNPEDIQKITIIRHAAIGDFMNIRPFLIELRSFFPHATVTLSVIKHYMYGIPEDLIDEVHVMRRYKEDGDKTSFFTRIKEAKKLPSQDIIFDLTDSTISLLLIALSDAKLKIGYPYRSIRRAFFDVATLRSDFVVEAVSVLHMLNILGKKTEIPLQYGLEKFYAKEEKKQIVYFAGASTKIKCWSETNFAQLINKMAQAYPEHQHIILQGIGDDEEFLLIYETVKKLPNTQLQKTMPLQNVMQLLTNSQLLISNDTGIRNIGIALEIPTIGIFFHIPPFRYWPREKLHDCVYNHEYTPPAVEDVYKASSNMLKKLYE